MNSKRNWIQVAGWRRLIGCLKLQVNFRRRATNYRALLWNMTYKDKASYDSSPPGRLKSRRRVCGVFSIRSTWSLRVVQWERYTIDHLVIGKSWPPRYHLERLLVGGMGWLELVGSIKLQVSFAKEPYKRDNILQKRPIIQSILLIVAAP